MCGLDVDAEDNFCRTCGAQLASPHLRTTGLRIIQPKSFALSGIFLLVLGTAVTVVTYLEGIIPIVALGLGCILLGVMTLFIPESTSFRAGRLATLSSLPSLTAIDALIKDLDIWPRGIYIPAKGFGAVPRVLLPLSDAPFAIPPGLARTSRVFVILGKNSNERGILLVPPGAEIVSALENCLQTDLSTIKLDDLEARLGFGLEILGISKRTVTVKVAERVATVQVGATSLVDLEEQLRAKAPRLVTQVGSPLISALAAVVSKASGKYVRIKDSTMDRSKLTVTLGMFADESEWN